MNGNIILFVAIGALLLALYGAVALTVAYHLRTYTINRVAARRALAVFLVVTGVLTVLQIAAAIMVASDLGGGGTEPAPATAAPVFGL